jgi:hypothetical protein
MEPNWREVKLRNSGKMPNPSGFPEFLIKNSGSTPSCFLLFTIRLPLLLAPNCPQR